MRKKEPSPIGDLIGPLLESYGIARPKDASALIERWAEVAGEPWASRSRPVQVRRGELLVEVADGGSASLLKYQTADLIRHIADQLGTGLVDSVRIRTSSRRSGEQRR